MHKEFCDTSVIQVHPYRGFLTQMERGVTWMVSLCSIYHWVNLHNCMLCSVSSDTILFSIYTVSILFFSVIGIVNAK